MSSGSRPDTFSVFVCYAHVDNQHPDASQQWLNRLLLHLKPLVLQSLVNTWSDQEIQAGDAWDAKIKSQLSQAGAAVLLVSPAFLASDYIRNSELPVLLMNAKQRGTVILPIILRPCLFKETFFKYPDPASGPEELSLASLQAAGSSTEPLNALKEHEQDRVLLSVAQRVLALARSAGRSATLPTGAIHNLPFERNRYFTGREEVLQALHDALSGQGATALTAISGMGGIGKTQTALEYGYRYAADYQAIFWVKADSHTALTSSFIELAALLNLPEKDAQESERAVRAVMNWLEHHSDWLMIFDNADAPELVTEFRPRNASGHVLLTSRAQLFDQLGISTPVEMPAMSPDEALAFLFTRTGRKGDNTAEQVAAAELAGELGYLPLALEQAGAYILAKKAQFQVYLTSYRKKRLALLQQAKPVAGKYPESVATTWALNFKEIERTSKAAADVLKASAFLSSDRIPFELISIGRKKLGRTIQRALADVEDDPLLMNQLLAPLMLYSLIRVDAEQQTYNIHRLVQEVVQTRMDEPARRLWAKRVVEALTEAFPDPEFKNWPTCERLMSHAKQAARLIQQWQFVSEPVTRLLNQVGSYSQDRGQYKDAESFYQESLKIRQQVFDSDHPALATGFNNLASLYREQGKFDTAEPLFKQALVISEKVHGPDHSEVATVLNNLGLNCIGQSRLDEAEPLLKRALIIWEKIFGPDHTYVATILNNLALICFRQEKFDEAESLINQALVIDEKALGSDHPDLAPDLHNLAVLYYRKGQFDKAEPLLKRALIILENARGPQHPYIANCLNSYARLLRDLHRDEEAAEMEARAKAIRQAQ